MAQPLLEH